MNLLSHYYLDHAHPSAYFKLGVLLPDLVRGFNKKLRRAVFAQPPVSPEHRQIVEGIRKHYAADAVFHNSAEFIFFCKLIGESLTPERFPSLQRRKYFAAHVFVELLLDRLLEKHSPQIPVKMKNDLGKTDAGVLKSYFTYLEKPVYHNEFFDNFNWLYRSKPLLFYSDNEMFGKALIRVYQRINPVPASTTEAEHLVALANVVEDDHRRRLLGIFEAVNSTLAAYA